MVSPNIYVSQGWCIKDYVYSFTYEMWNLSCENEYLSRFSSTGFQKVLHVLGLLLTSILLTLFFGTFHIYTDESMNLEILHLKSVKMSELSNNAVVMAIT